jgi:SNF2 family DNA or RNA helicase
LTQLISSLTGKTIQSVAFIASLFSEGFTPALVIVPLATVGNWEREFSIWAPHLYTVTYGGTPNNRQILKNYVSSTRSAFLFLLLFSLPLSIL